MGNKGSCGINGPSVACPCHNQQQQTFFSCNNSAVHAIYSRGCHRPNDGLTVGLVAPADKEPSPQTIRRGLLSRETNGIHSPRETAVVYMSLPSQSPMNDIEATGVCEFMTRGKGRTKNISLISPSNPNCLSLIGL